MFLNLSFMVMQPQSDIDLPTSIFLKKYIIISIEIFAPILLPNSMTRGLFF